MPWVASPFFILIILLFFEYKIGAMAKEIAELEQLEEVLKIEKQQDFELFRKMVQALPLEERKARGYSWYPIQVIGKGYTFGERAFVVVEKNDNERSHQFRSGKVINLFSREVGVYQPEKSGVIHYIEKNRMKIILNAKDLPEWLGLGKIGVDLLFDETTYQEMEKAMKKVIKARQDRLAELRAVLLGEMTPRFKEITNPISIPVLNPSQNAAINQILAAEDVAVVHGPPGTGKTTMIVQAVRLLCQQEHTVLVTAPSNTAVDLLTERLDEVGLVVVRIGNISRMDEGIVRHTLDMQLSDHPDSKNIKKVKIQAADARRNARRFKRKFGRIEREERQQLHKEARDLMAWANQLEDRLIDQILDGAQVITATLVGTANRVLEKRRFRTVVIDEAAQAMEPATWIPVTKASKVVMTGDPFQLPPTIKSAEAKQQGLSITLIEKALQRLDHTSLLNVQYRMHEKIMGFSNQRFYNGQLQAAEGVGAHTLPIVPNVPVIFIDTAGCGFEEKVNEAFQSRYNPDEFQILCEHLYQLVEAFGEQTVPDIALISPYREQVIHMKELSKADPQLNILPLTINTIDGFQGQEREVVYISLVRSNEKGEIGFLKDYRRMNVAMTRAKKQLIVIGDSATIGQDDFFNAFMEYCEMEGEYKTAWEYMQ